MPVKYTFLEFFKATQGASEILNKSTHFCIVTPCGLTGMSKIKQKKYFHLIGSSKASHSRWDVPNVRVGHFRYASVLQYESDTKPGQHIFSSVKTIEWHCTVKFVLSNKWIICLPSQYDFKSRRYFDSVGNLIKLQVWFLFLKSNPLHGKYIVKNILYISIKTDELCQETHFLSLPPPFYKQAHFKNCVYMLKTFMETTSHENIFKCYRL